MKAILKMTASKDKVNTPLDKDYSKNNQGILTVIGKIRSQMVLADSIFQTRFSSKVNGLMVF